MTAILVPTRARVRAFLDDLAVLTVAHGLMLDGYKVRLGALPEAAATTDFGGYAAVRRGYGTDEWWEVHPYAAGSKMGVAQATDDGRAASIDVVGVTGHQRLDLELALLRIREILHGPA